MPPTPPVKGCRTVSPAKAPMPFPAFVAIFAGDSGTLNQRMNEKERTMPTDRFAKKHWKMVLVLIAICGAMLLLRWAAMIWGE